MNQGFSDRQLRLLASPLDEKRIQRREHEGRTIFYIEGWYALAEANAIFGFDGWDRETIHLEKLFERSLGESTNCGYAARVRITVRARGRVVVREGTGFGQVSGAYALEAHETAIKAAETDATKRALATFGGRFGLLLYDKDTRDGLDRALSAEQRDAAPSDHTGSAGERKIQPQAGRITGCRTKNEPSEGAENQGFTITTANGEFWPVASAESYCTGFRQLVERARSSEELLFLRRANQNGLMRLRTIAGLTTPRGEHFADILERLLARRAREIRAIGIADAGTACAGDADKESHLVVPLGALETGKSRSRVDKGSPGGVVGKSLPAGITSAEGSMQPSLETPQAAGPSEVESDEVRGGAPDSEGGADAPDESVEGPVHGDPYPETADICGSGLPGLNAELGVSARPLEQPQAQQASSQTDGAAASIKTYVPVPPYPLKSMKARVLNTRTRGEQQNGTGSDVRGSEHGSSSDEITAEEPKRLPMITTSTRRSKINGGYSIDKSVLAVPSERRLRSKAHLVKVAALPCLVCEEIPCHAHHITFAQPRGLSLKVSDEFTVPLCVKHHNEVHAKGNEASWWREQGIEPLAHAQKLWLVSAGLLPDPPDRPVNNGSSSLASGLAPDDAGTDRGSELKN